MSTHRSSSFIHTLQLAVFTAAVLLTGLILPTTALALENYDSVIPVCSITIGNIDLTPGAGTTVYPREISGSKRIYDITVCGEDRVFSEVHGDQQAPPNICMNNSRSLVVAIETGTYGWFGSTWQYASLEKTGNNCFKGSIETTPTIDSISVDIELDRSNNTCQASMPVCRRVKAKFSKDLLVDDAACTEAKNEFENCEFVNFDKTIFLLNDTLAISGKLPNVNSLECGGAGLKHATIQIIDPNAALILNEKIEYDASFRSEVKLNNFGNYSYTIFTSDTTTVGSTSVTTKEYRCSGRFRVCSPDDETCRSILPPDSATTPYSLPFELCAQASNELPSGGGKSSQKLCEECLGTGADSNSAKGIWTAVGCIKTEPKAIVESVVQIGVGVGGGIALLMTLIGGFLLTTSQGDPKRTQEGKDMITSSVIGIIFVLFSVVVLQFVGVTVLRLPGFGVS